MPTHWMSSSNQILTQNDNSRSFKVIRFVVNEEPLRGFIVQYNNCGHECEGLEDTSRHVAPLRDGLSAPFPSPFLYPPPFPPPGSASTAVNVRLLNRSRARLSSILQTKHCETLSQNTDVFERTTWSSLHLSIQVYLYMYTILGSRYIM